jgi:cell division septation protein DedD
MASLAEIRAKLQSMESKGSSQSSQQSDNAIYPHWNIDEGTSATLRFLPDGDTTNDFFWVERQMIRLTFPGVKGGDMKPVTVQVPCAEMYGDTCPVLTEVRPWFKDPSLEDMGRKYWKKRSYIFQGFVTENPLNETSPENPIRRFVISPQIFNIIKSALMDPDMENLPVDYVNGTDFRVTKTTKGQYADYSTSKYARKERALDETELAAIDANGLYTLKDFLPKRPDQEHLQAIAQMFEASVNGDLYDSELWGNFYKPYGLEVPSTAVQATSASAQTAPVTQQAPTPAPVAPAETSPAPVAPAEPAPVAESTPEPVTESAASGDKPSADDILSMIRARQ